MVPGNITKRNSREPQVSATVLQAFGLGGGKPTLFDSGLINRSWRIDMPDGGRFVLQRVNPIFPASINGDIDAVTRHLRNKGMCTPLIVPTQAGEPALIRGEEVWRALTYIPGVARDELDNTRQAFRAGALLGRFHSAVSDLDHTFSNPRLGVHDTAAHLENLRRTLASHGDHPQYGRVAPIAERILALAGRLPKLPLSNKRIVHGDPKISNFIFDPESDEAIALVDLDTVASMPVILELGDAFRSWCNPLGEDSRETECSVPIFEAALSGYAREARDLLTDEEWAGLPAATLTIALELSARFAADALIESYFGWDSSRFRSASEHNQLRAVGQLSLAESVRTQWKTLQTAVNAAEFGMY